MGKMAVHSPLLGPLTLSTTPKGQDRKRARKAKGSKTTGGEMSVTSPLQQHGELASSAEPKPPTEAEMIKERARSEKRRATEDWIAGHKTTRDHEAIHKRANHVLMNKRPGTFRGKTGERAPKKGGPW
jgi:hypothetical protein